MIVGISLATVLLLVILAYVIAAWGSPEVDTLPFEFRKYLIQFFLIAALGAVVTVLIEYFKRRAERREQEEKAQAERREQERQYRTSTLTSLLERLDLIYQRVKQTRQPLGFIYHRVKQTRQRLGFIYQRVKQTRQRLGIRPGHRADNIDEIWELRGEQQDLELLALDIDFHKRMFPELDHVHELVKKMENYLGEIWRQYRLQFRDAPVSEGSFEERLRKFVESPKDDKESDFPKFSLYYHGEKGSSQLACSYCRSIWGPTSAAIHVREQGGRGLGSALSARGPLGERLSAQCS